MCTRCYNSKKALYISSIKEWANNHSLVLESIRIDSEVVLVSFEFDSVEVMCHSRLSDSFEFSLTTICLEIFVKMRHSI
jgi:hypothetical protein